jgi:RNA recognition motif-containing protein
VIKNKFTGQVAGYGFVNFSNDQQALTAMHRLNGKIMPYSQPPTRYNTFLPPVVTSFMLTLNYFRPTRGNLVLFTTILG